MSTLKFIDFYKKEVCDEVQSMKSSGKIKQKKHHQTDSELMAEINTWVDTKKATVINMETIYEYYGQYKSEPYSVGFRLFCKMLE